MEKTPHGPASVPVVVFVSHCMGRRRQQFANFNYTMIRDNFKAPYKSPKHIDISDQAWG